MTDFRDHERSLPERVGDLIGRLTVDEKIALLHQYQPPITRLGVRRIFVPAGRAGEDGHVHAERRRPGVPGRRGGAARGGDGPAPFAVLGPAGVCLRELSFTAS